MCLLNFFLSVVELEDNLCCLTLMVKGKVIPYLLPGIGPGADPDVQAVSLPHPSGGGSPLLFASLWLPT